MCVIARVCNDLDARLSGRMLIHTLVLSGLTATDVGGFMGQHRCHVDAFNNQLGT